MTKLIIDLSNAALESHPDDAVVIWAPAHREGKYGQVVTPARKLIKLTGGEGEEEVEPGPLVIKTQVQAIADTAPKQVVVPDQESITLSELLDSAYVYTPQVVNRALETIKGAVGEAVEGEVGQILEDTKSAAWNAAVSASTAAARALSADGKSDNAVGRVAALEAMSGLSPESPADGQTANLVLQGGSLTRAAISGLFAEDPPGSGLYSIPEGI